VAENIIEKPIPDKFFKRQNDYKSIRKSQMEILLDKLMEE
jgi:hypothetical protein